MKKNNIAGRHPARGEQEICSTTIQWSNGQMTQITNGLVCHKFHVDTLSSGRNWINFIVIYCNFRVRIGSWILVYSFCCCVIIHSLSSLAFLEKRYFWANAEHFKHQCHWCSRFSWIVKLWFNLWSIICVIRINSELMFKFIISTLLA